MSETRIRELVKRSQRQNDLAAMDAGVLEFDPGAEPAAPIGFPADVIRWFIWEEGSTIARWKYEWEEIEYDAARIAITVVDGRSGSFVGSPSVCHLNYIDSDLGQGSQC